MTNKDYTPEEIEDAVTREWPLERDILTDMLRQLQRQLAERDAEIEWLRSGGILSQDEVEEVKHLLDGEAFFSIGGITLNRLCEAALAANTLANALQFYADENNNEIEGAVFADGGEKARQALRECGIIVEEPKQ